MSKARGDLAHIILDCDSGVWRLPEHLQEGLRAYVIDGKRPGGFLVALIENDLMTAACKADPLSLAALPALARFLYNDVPGPAWGSRAKREAWESIGGARGWVRSNG